MSTLAENLKRNIIDTCISCGTCAKICPSIQVAGLDQVKAKVIQEHLLDFIKAPQADDMVSRRIDSCLECFKCVDVCPKDLNPLTFIELSKFTAFQNGHEPYASAKPADYRAHYKSIKNDLNEHQRSAVTRTSESTKSKYVFFPGCNIYKSATRLLKVKEILNTINPDIAFLPGLEFCCGDAYVYEGRIDLGVEKYGELSKEIADINPDRVILWCPTCLCRMKKTWDSSIEYISFFQFCLAYIDKLNFTSSATKKAVTLHEPCKTAYTGLDQSHRGIIRALPNYELREMPSGISCCGSGGISYYKDETVNLITEKRLQEAVDTQADMLITVCHYCQELFEDINSNETLEITNLADLLHQEFEDHEKIQNSNNK